MARVNAVQVDDKSIKKECFVVSPIGDAGTATRKHADMVLNSIIRPVATRPELNFTVCRADELSDPGMINDQVILKITSAQLVIADLSFLNPNVFYEIGLRHAIGKPIVHIASTDTKLPFDTLGYRCLNFDISDWHSHESARTALAEAIQATLSPNYKVSNPLTQAKAVMEFSQSADSTEKALFDALRRIEKLERLDRAPRKATSVKLKGEDGGEAEQYDEFCSLVVRRRGVEFPTDMAFEAIKHYLENVGAVGPEYLDEVANQTDLSPEQIAELKAIGEKHRSIMGN